MRRTARPASTDFAGAIVPVANSSRSVATRTVCPFCCRAQLSPSTTLSIPPSEGRNCRVSWRIFIASAPRDGAQADALSSHADDGDDGEEAATSLGKLRSREACFCHGALLQRAV